MGAEAPIKIDAMNELTSATSAVAAYDSGSVFQNFLICGPVKRSIAREPVIVTTLRASASAAVISAHSALVELSIQIGELRRLSSGRTCSTKGRALDQRGASVMRVFRSTEPCC